jgi:hypothetical protein
LAVKRRAGAEKRTAPGRGRALSLLKDLSNSRLSGELGDSPP